MSKYFCENVVLLWSTLKALTTNPKCQNFETTLYLAEKQNNFFTNQWKILPIFFMEIQIFKENFYHNTKFQKMLISFPCQHR